MTDKIKLSDIVSLAKRRGFVFQGSEIYGGWEAAYDFGPLGVEILRNLKNLWWKEFVQKQPDIVGLDGAIISHPRVWEASGHVDSFADVMVEDLVTHKRYRADHLVDEVLGIISDGYSLKKFDKVIDEKKILSPDGNKLSKAKYFNQLVEVKVGTTEDAKSTAYLRGETCQPIFCNYNLVKNSMRLKIPFGIAQIGKAFRNEIKVGPYFFRTREFEQMEIEMYINPKDSDKYFEKFKKWSINWLKSLGIDAKKLRLRDQEFKERAHYNKIATDVEYNFPFGWKEFQGIHYRGDWDLSRHGKYSGHDFSYKDEGTGEKYIPHIVEYSIGLSRLLLILLFNSYEKKEKRTILKIKPSLAPYKIAVFPLLGNKDELKIKARSLFEELLENFTVAWDDRGNIGKRYFSQDEIGTPFCATVDFDTLSSDMVTIRDRDTMKQVKVNISQVDKFLQKNIT